MNNKDINYALVEAKRPPIYTAMKYWGKKPHNIWNEYINCYTPNGGCFLDPFCGSAMSAFEAVNLGRTAYAFDLNPLSTFIIEVLSSDFDLKNFSSNVINICEQIDCDKQYIDEYTITCKNCNENATIINYKWNEGKIYEVAVECKHCGKRYTIPVDKDDNFYYEKTIDLPYWYPQYSFPSSESFSKSFIKNIGGNDFSFLWTKRNLYILSAIFDKIQNVKNENIKKQLLFGFIQTLHLCSKMCVPRSKDAKRDFSTSWGRSVYICAKKQMEMNPLHLFKNNCLGKQSVQSSLNSAKNYLKIKPKICDITKNFDKSANLFYGIIDIKSLTKYINKNSIDFILTDPPYGGLVKYFDLSLVWLSWLSKIDNKYIPDYKNEITVSNGNLNSFYDDFLKGLNQLYTVLKPEGKIVFTFNNNDVQIWNMFLNAIADSGFSIEKVIHQQNKRTGESNVSSKFGMSSSDFYIRCVKGTKKNTYKILDSIEYENFIVNTAKDIIRLRNEPTNYDILFAGLISELSCANINVKDCNQAIEDVLKKHIDQDFIIKQENGTKWFLKDYKNPNKTLSQKVENAIKNYTKKHSNINRDILLGVIFRKFPNGLTPDPMLVNKLIDEAIKEVKNDK